MGRERNVLLRRTSPLARGGVVLLAPATGHASSFSPDPPPGANGLGLILRRRLRPARPTLPARAQAGRDRLQPAPGRAVTTPAVRARTARVAAPTSRRSSGRARTRPGSRLPKLELPPVVVPAFIPATLRPAAAGRARGARSRARGADGRLGRRARARLEQSLMRRAALLCSRSGSRSSSPVLQAPPARSCRTP